MRKTVRRSFQGGDGDSDAAAIGPAHAGEGVRLVHSQALRVEASTDLESRGRHGVLLPLTDSHRNSRSRNDRSLALAAREVEPGVRPPLTSKHAASSSEVLTLDSTERGAGSASCA